MNNDNSLNESLRRYAWDYFQIHSSQRLTTFNFYIVISSVVITALFSAFQQNYKFPYVGILLGALLSFFSFVFWKLDGRNQFIIKQAEESLKYIEKQTLATGSEEDKNEPHFTQLFLREEYLTGIAKKQRIRLIWKRNFSYSDCFNLVFFTFGITGLASVLYLITFG